MKPLPLVDLAAVHAELGDELEAAVLRICRSQRFIGGDEVAEFESEFAEFLGAPHVVGVANGTDALSLCLRAFGIGAGDEVLVPANTFIATAEGVDAVGAEPVFVDVDEASGLIDLESCAAAVTEATRAIIPVHLYGRMADMRAVAEFATEHGLEVLEDAAQAHGAQRDGIPAALGGRAGTFSFYPGKNLGAFGDAGAIATTDAELAAELRLLRDHGRQGRDNHAVRGFNSRLDAIQAAALRVKLPRLRNWTEARRRAADAYREALPATVLDWRPDEPEAEAHHLFPILHQDRDDLAAHLQDHGVSTGVHYRQALTVSPAFGGAQRCPAAESRAERQLSLPLHPHLDAEDIERVAGLVSDFVAERPAQASVASSR
jgi:dTDP-4-amino-4,6-dideoxygalactose transaminase